MNKTYLLDRISFDMFRNFPLPMTVNKVDNWYFCSLVNTDSTLVNALRSKTSADLVNEICDTKLKPHRLKVKIKPGDVILNISINSRLPKVHTLDDIAKLIDSGKISFYEVLI